MIESIDVATQMRDMIIVALKKSVAEGMNTMRTARLLARVKRWSGDNDEAQQILLNQSRIVAHTLRMIHAVRNVPLAVEKVTTAK